MSSAIDLVEKIQYNISEGTCKESEALTNIYVILEYDRSGWVKKTEINLILDVGHCRRVESLFK